MARINWRRCRGSNPGHPRDRREYLPLYYNDVVKLLQHSGLGSNTGMGFLRTNDLSEIKTGELNLDFGVWLKTWKWMF